MEFLLIIALPIIACVLFSSVWSAGVNTVMDESRTDSFKEEVKNELKYTVKGKY